MKFIWKPFNKISLFALFSLTLGSCTSYEQFQYLTQELEIPTSIYKFDYAQTWQSVLAVMKKYDLSMQNQESGVIQTRWIDNTLELNFADSFGSSDAVKSAKFKVVVNVIKGFRSGREVTKVTVFKRQMIKQDFLQGWKIVPTDKILEKTILYRIERNLTIEAKIKKIEEIKNKAIEQSF